MEIFGGKYGGTVPVLVSEFPMHAGERYDA